MTPKRALRIILPRLCHVEPSQLGKHPRRRASSSLAANASSVRIFATRRAKAKALARSDASNDELEREVVVLEEEMFQAAEELRFERAAELRDAIKELRRELDERRGLAREPRTAPTPARRGRRSAGRRR